MKELDPESAGWTRNRLLSSSGEVQVYSTEGGRELWCMPARLENAAEALLVLGTLGIGGFEAGGSYGEGVWLVRSNSTPTLKQLWSEEIPPWQSSVAIAREIATRLAVCEERGVWPGALHPSNIVAHGIRPSLRAEELVRAELGLEAAQDTGSVLGRWTPPVQAAGKPWDAAANRFVLGLILYRMLAGEHPLTGQGLRLGLERLGTRGAAPFSEDRAQGLPPGLQAYCLSMLAPSSERRPPNAAAIASALGQFLHAPSAGIGESNETRDKPQPVRTEPKSARAPASGNGSSQARSGASSWPLGASLLLSLLGVLSVVTLLVASPVARQTHAIQERRPFTSGLLGSAACESCHPRQTAEWRRSVMAHSAKSPLFLALEALIEEQVGRSFDCAHGAGIMRKPLTGRECRDPETGIVLTGAAGEHWCVNCHAPGDNLDSAMPAWDARAVASASRLPLDSLLPRASLEGISCAFCHQVHGPAGRLGELAGYVGNPSWISPATGVRFPSRPEDQLGRFGIANSGYRLDSDIFLAGQATAEQLVTTGMHRRTPADARAYLQSSEFCGACHDVRLFGTDVIGAERGEHFKRLRNGYSEWRQWARLRKVQGRAVHSCQDCHMSRFPGTCVKAANAEGGQGCPPKTRFVAAQPGSYPEGAAALGDSRLGLVRPHYFSGVDVPLTPEFPEQLIDDATVDGFGIPLGARQRRDLLLSQSVSMTLDTPALSGRTLRVPLTFENTGAGHRIPAGFSQERELWVQLLVTDSRGELVYEVGRVERGDQDLADKLFLRTNTEERVKDAEGRPLGMFGADVADGPDVPRWSPDPALGGTEFRGYGLVNFQNGFLRCVVCIGRIDAEGRCQPLPGQESARADRYADGGYDIDSGRCASNLSGGHALFETYFPVGSLDATRGLLKAPDAIIDTRSLPPEVPIRYTYELPLTRLSPPYTVEAKLLFRAFPPFLIRAFVDYEARQASLGKRPRGPLIDARALDRLEVVELARVVGRSQ